MPKLNQDDLQIELPMMNSKPRIYSSSLANHYTIYLTGELVEPSEYTEEFFILKTASANDHIDIEINGFGGDLSTAVQFFNAIMSSEASVTTILNGNAYSAHSMILLGGDSTVVMPNTSFMVHNGIGGSMGKIEDNLKAAKHSSAMTRGILDTVYEGFLTPEEIDQAQHGYEFWMESDEVVDRLQKRTEYFQQLEKELAEDSDGCDAMKQMYVEAIDDKLEN